MRSTLTFLVLAVTIFSSGSVLASTSGFEIGQLVSFDPISNLAEIAGAWTQTGIACVELDTGKILKYSDTGDNSNRITISPKNNAVREWRGSEKWNSPPFCIPYVGSGSITVASQTPTLIVNLGLPQIPVGRGCQVESQFQNRNNKVFRVQGDSLGFQAAERTHYFSCDKFENAAVTTIWQSLIN